MKKIVIVLIIVATFFYYWFSTRPTQKLDIYFLNVGQGDSILIISPDGKTLLVDGGEDEKAVVGLNNKMGVFNQRIDYIIATHPDNDHIGGLDEVIDAYQVGVFISPKTDKKTKTYLNLVNKINSKNIEKVEATEDADFLLGCCVKIDLVWPAEEASDKIKDDNSNSVSFFLYYGDFKAFFDGDLPQELEDEVVARNPVDINLLKVSHHGSKTATSEKYLSILRPEIAIISVGKDNSYRHPDISVVNRLKNLNAKVMRTDELGEIHYQTDGTNFLFTNI
jgi:competence protein ComEC